MIFSSDVGGSEVKHKRFGNLSFFCLLTTLCLGTSSVAFSTPMILNFQIEDSTGGQYNNAKFSYIVDKDNPFWTKIEGYAPSDQNRYKYHVKFYEADNTLGIMPDMVLETSKMIMDIESGITIFNAGSSANGDNVEILSCASWYFWDLIKHINDRPQFMFTSQSLGFYSTNCWLTSVEHVPSQVSEPSTVILFSVGMGFFVLKILRSFKHPCPIRRLRYNFQRTATKQIIFLHYSTPLSENYFSST
ncbi:MAG: hypothetical protein COA36_08905 [Desulfotalea sp.]|nr:MAG: hypothetical protein COA36_08905 [Desulfotalea sp.]